MSDDSSEIEVRSGEFCLTREHLNKLGLREKLTRVIDNTNQGLNGNGNSPINEPLKNKHLINPRKRSKKVKMELEDDKKLNNQTENKTSLVESQNQDKNNPAEKNQVGCVAEMAAYSNQNENLNEKDLVMNGCNKSLDVEVKIKSPLESMEVDEPQFEETNPEKTEYFKKIELCDKNSVPKKIEVSTKSELTNSDNESTKKRRINFTGNTVKMINTLFTHFKEKNVENDFSLEPTKTSQNNQSENSDSVAPIAVDRPRGRPRGRPRKDDTVMKGPGRKRKKDSLCNSAVNENDQVKCAVCCEEMKKTVWTHHKQRYHNNLAWRIGDPPFDLSDQSFVIQTLNSLYKKKKPLYCNNCGESKKSVVGFLSHQTTCNKSQEEVESVKITCELCDKKVLPVSMATHIKLVHSPMKEEQLALKQKEKEEKIEVRITKRLSAKKAMQIINQNVANESYFTTNLDFNCNDLQEIVENELIESGTVHCKYKGCDFESDILENVIEHLNDCEDKPFKAFLCKLCLESFPAKNDINNHLKLIHNIETKPDIEADADFALPSINNVLNKKLPQFLSDCKYSLPKKNILFPKAFEWTMHFREENFSKLLFPEFVRNPDLLPVDSVERFLPKLGQCCDVAQIFVKNLENPLAIDYDFKKYDLFNAELHENGNATIFCGGPVTALAWLPTPHNTMNANQILAVSVLNTPDEKYRLFKNYKVPSMIQFWDFGALDNKNQNDFQPDFVFGFAHEHGPVRHLEWCPSGCYNKFEGGRDGKNEEEIERSGLLAAAGSDSAVYIYSVPFQAGFRAFYKPLPVLKLLLQESQSELLGGENYYPTRISWTNASGHSYIAVGYTNGMVALFDLNHSTNPNMSVKDENGTTCLLPYQSFAAHSHAITALILNHLNEGCRWLVSGSMDRNFCLWDLNNLPYPITTVKKNIVTDGIWMTNWLCHVVSCDDLSISPITSTFLKQPRDFMTDSISLLNSHSTVNSISGSDWLNGVIQGNAVGEISAVFPPQLFYAVEQDRKRQHKRLLLGYTCLIEKNKTVLERLQEDAIKKANLESESTSTNQNNIDLGSNLHCNEPLDYLGVQEKYGLVFCDYEMDSLSNFPKNILNTSELFPSSYHISKPNLYPLQSISKIVLNPNRQASIFFATGYEAGFLRLAKLEFLKDDPQIQ